MRLEDIDPREDKLPKWAQERFSEARRRVRDAEADARLARLESGTPDSDTFLEPWQLDIAKRAEPIKLGRGATVRFVVPSGYIEVQVDRPSGSEPYVRVSAESAVSIVPQSSNVVRIRNGEY